MNEMIKRVAKAIYDRSLDADQLADFGLPMEDAMTMATAAIKAMREPTDKMLLAACTAVGHADSVKFQLTTYQAMIDEILK